MTITGPASFEDLPEGLKNALGGEWAVYCNVCDGIRLPVHECREWYPGVKAQYEAKGVELQSKPFRMN